MGSLFDPCLDMPDNAVLIHVAAGGLGICPPDRFPEVCCRWESFRIAVDWSKNGGAWASVTVENFRPADPNDPNPLSPGTSVTIPAGDYDAKEIKIPPVTKTITLLYDVKLVSAADATKTFVLDPAVILRP